MPSRAEIYFREFVPVKEDGTDDLKAALAQMGRLIAEKKSNPRFEDDWLEYKSGKLFNNYFAAQKGSAEHKKLAENPRKLSYEKKKRDYRFYEQWKTELKNVWAEYLSAFANNEGGVIIWGIYGAKETNEEGNTVDIPSEEHLIDDLPAAQTALQTFQNNAIDPPLTGVINVSIPKKQGGSAGFIVSFIPAGIARPHMAMMDCKRVYLRTGGSSTMATPTLMRMLYATYRSYRAQAFIVFEQDTFADLLRLAVVIENLGPLTLVKPQIVISCDGATFPANQPSTNAEAASRQLFYDVPIDISWGTRRPFQFHLNKTASEKLTWTVSLSVRDAMPLVGKIESPWPLRGVKLVQLFPMNPDEHGF